MPTKITDINLPQCNLTSQRTLHFVHLGALVPGKGFLDIAKQWETIKSRFPNAVLNVIGSASVYDGIENVHPLIPTSYDFASRILQYIPIDDIKNSKVIFHGNLGTEKQTLIQKAHLALQNPTGISEAFPASPLECMSLGTPVIASDDFGMHDTMKFFPELTLKNPSEISDKIAYALSSPKIYQGLKLRALSVSSFYSSLSDESIFRWLQLIDCGYTSFHEKIKSQLHLSFFNFLSPPFLLLYRTLKRHIRLKIRGS